MINREKLLIIFVIIIALGSCGRKGDLLPPPNLTSMLSSNSVMSSK
jgi:predicted small lipoprotein YifL|tara:strand:+ start:370 stop:507 length:138 start_codon:yes stop_codon:yes gene_type:complete